MISERFTRFTYLYNIVSLDNLQSIIQYGILSKNEMNRLNLIYSDISNRDVQNRRDRVIVPGGEELHAYANLYFNPRNAMLYSRLNQINNLCILRIDKKVLNYDTTVVSDINAAVAGARFWSPKEALRSLNFDVIQSKSWDYPDFVKKQQYKQRMMAEVLVLNKVKREYIVEILVPNETVYEKVEKMRLNIPVSINHYFFFKE